LNPSKQQEVEGLFAAHGYDGRLKIAQVTSEDERIFVLARDALDSLSDVNVLLISLQEVLRRKVWIVDESPAWADVVPFD
jgi:hypothetical protein